MSMQTDLIYNFILDYHNFHQESDGYDDWYYNDNALMLYYELYLIIYAIDRW